MTDGAPQASREDALGVSAEGLNGEPESKTPTRMDRRTFILWAAGTSLGASAFFLFATLYQALLPPARSIDGTSNVGPLVVARMSDLQLDTPLITDYGEDRVYVVKVSATEAVVFDAACPHARCTLGFDEGAEQFACPCHASTFTIEGRKISGPAPRDMVRAAAEVVSGDVIVSGFES
jgi:Rieske Fe-S protein